MVDQIATETLAIIGGDIGIDVAHGIGAGGEVITSAIVVADGINVRRVGRVIGCGAAPA